MKQVYTNLVENLLADMPLEQAMSAVVGGRYDVIGQVEVAILRYYGLQPHHHLIDVGCGSGRLAKPLSEHHHGKYSGFDIVRKLIDYAREIVGRPDWRFEVIDNISIPETDHCADMVCFFSVFTHLLHEQSYWYLEESIRVLKPGGKIIFSFLEFREPDHWPIFMNTLVNAKGPTNNPINVFISREEIEVWAKHLGLKIEAFHDATSNVWQAGALGQSLCVLSTPQGDDIVGQDVEKQPRAF